MPKSSRKPAGPARIVRLFETDGRWYWKPDKRLRPFWKSHPLGSDAGQARREARRLNAEAEAWLKSPGQARAAAPRVARGPVTVGTLIAEYRASAAWLKLRPRTRVTYAYELVRLEREFGHEPAIGLDTVRVDDWWEELRLTAPETARHVAARGRVVFHWAGRRKLVPRDHNPFATMGFGGGNRRKNRFTWEDVRHLVATADAAGLPSIGTVLMIAFCCMQRITDVITLDTSRLVMVEDRLRLQYHQSKGGKIKERGAIKPGFFVDMPLPDAVVARLDAMTIDRSVAQPLAVSERTGKPHHEKTVSRIFARVLAQAIKADPKAWKHLKGGQLRDGRRSGFVHAIEQGCSVELATSWSGHSIEEGMAIIEVYLPRTAKMADGVDKFMKVAL